MYVLRFSGSYLYYFQACNFSGKYRLAHTRRRLEFPGRITRFCLPQILFILLKWKTFTHCILQLIVWGEHLKAKMTFFGHFLKQGITSRRRTNVKCTLETGATLIQRLVNFRWWCTFDIPLSSRAGNRWTTYHLQPSLKLEKQTF